MAELSPVPLFLGGGVMHISPESPFISEPSPMPFCFWEGATEWTEWHVLELESPISFGTSPDMPFHCPLREIQWGKVPNEVLTLKKKPISLPLEQQNLGGQQLDGNPQQAGSVLNKGAYQRWSRALEQGSPTFKKKPNKQKTQLIVQTFFSAWSLKSVPNSTCQHGRNMHEQLCWLVPTQATRCSTE